MPLRHRVPRPTGRVLLISPADRLLLFSARSRGPLRRRWWLTPGGGLLDGESPAQAAIRELAEETGHVVSEQALGPVVATSYSEWTAGRTVYLATHTYFSVRADHDRVDTSAQEELERSVITGHRWWSAQELAATSEQVRPHGLDVLLAQLISAGPPAEPVRLPSR